MALTRGETIDRSRNYRSVRCMYLIRSYPPSPQSKACYDEDMYSQKFQVDVIVAGVRRACPLEWLDQFCMRNFTNPAEFDDTLPIAEGKIEASFRVTPERFAENFGSWLTQRGKGEGQPIQVEITQF